jgi:TfoX/Sxy family transcriptional regulator of competence genes
MADQSISTDERIALYNKLVASHPDADRKGDTIPYTSLNGNMYSYLSKDGFLALRLAAADREAFLGKYKTTLVYAYGIIQKEYVTVPDSLLKNTDELKPYFQLSYQYVSSLKPKAATKSKKKS